MEGKKNVGLFKIYAVSLENFERIADRAWKVYVARLNATRQQGHYVLIEFSVVASGKNEIGELVELVVDCGRAYHFQERFLEECREKSEKVFEFLKGRLSENGFCVEEGRISGEPMFAEFDFKKMGGEK